MSEIDDKTKSYFQSLARWTAYLLITMIATVLLSISTALIGKWTGITPAVPTFSPPPMPMKAQPEALPLPAQEVAQ